MKRYIASVAVLLATASLPVVMASGAGAATSTPASSPPRPSCWIGAWFGPCHCPSGWHTEQGTWSLHCAKN